MLPTTHLHFAACASMSLICFSFEAAVCWAMVNDLRALSRRLFASSLWQKQGGT
jgi:hypothetical protein